MKYYTASNGARPIAFTEFGCFTSEDMDYMDWDTSRNTIGAGWAIIRQDGSCPACDALHDLLWGRRYYSCLS